VIFRLSKVQMCEGFGRAVRGEDKENIIQRTGWKQIADGREEHPYDEPAPR
jgi:hypothetical protein